MLSSIPSGKKIIFDITDTIIPIEIHLIQSKIQLSIFNLEENTFSDPILIGNNYLILKINEIKEIPVKINKEKELEKMIMIETSKQLDKFANIFSKKIIDYN